MPCIKNLIGIYKVHKWIFLINGFFRIWEHWADKMAENEFAADGYGHSAFVN